MIKKENLPECPVATTVQLIGSKWKLLILRDLLTGKKRYNELKRSLPDISQKVLTASLKSMVNDGLGESMRPVIQSMQTLGSYYKDQIQ